MALSLSCTCGARFEVEDTFAGQDIRCPECQSALKAPTLQRLPVRTSDLALASFVLALAGFATVVGTVAAVILGVWALVSIGRHRDRLSGAGYAVAGIVAGLVFTSLVLFAVVKAEVAGVQDLMHQQAMTGQIDCTGPLEIVRPTDGFAIVRPSAKWGVVKPEAVDDPLIYELEKNGDLLLVHVAKFAFVDVRMERKQVDNLSLDECRKRMLAYYDGKAGDALFPGNEGLLRFTPHYKLREDRRLPSQGGADGMELLLDTRYGGKGLTFLIRLYKEKDGGTLYIVRGWTTKRGYAGVQKELTEAVSSFRLLGP